MITKVSGYNTNFTSKKLLGVSNIIMPTQPQIMPPPLELLFGIRIGTNQNVIQSTCTKVPKEWLIHIQDLIKPDDLKNLKEWKDYIFLIHDSDKTARIKKEGLKCCTDINPKLAKIRKNAGFCNDPDLIYFRPKTPHSDLGVNKHSIVIAVPKNKVRVFNQEERVSQNFRFYCGTSMTVSEYDKLLSKIKSGECLRRDKQIVPYEKAGFDIYIPEVCFDDMYISPEYFVKL